MKVMILGAGAYGCALATVLNENNHSVTLWAHFEKDAKDLSEKRESPRLPGIKLPKELKFTTNMEEVKKADLIIIAIPTAYLNEVAQKLKKYYNNTPICIATKGIEQGSCRFVYDILKENLDTEKLAVISGPSFAIDIANNFPVGLALASQDKETIDLVIKALANKRFKLRKTNDIVGVEICGAIKNVIAIAAGIIAGMKVSDSTKAMFITESLHDIKSLIKGLGSDGDTVLTYAGFGDLLLTATSEKSRNYSLGYLIGSGNPKEVVDEYIKNTTIEGLYTLKSINDLVKDKDVEMPMINLIERIIYENEKPTKLIDFLIEK
ncbi:MAG: NAD(P)H-dependent glycerol-3-phosphate dehydrogenase [Bacilli bacterium]|nr:NAD(P)H-dependent glycerol-3-phosphate dehydrogenase [Bacilli bacterium]